MKINFLNCKCHIECIQYAQVICCIIRTGCNYFRLVVLTPNKTIKHTIYKKEHIRTNNLLKISPSRQNQTNAGTFACEETLSSRRSDDAEEEEAIIRNRTSCVLMVLNVMHNTASREEKCVVSQKTYRIIDN